MLEFFSDHWGDVASVLGLLTSLGVLVLSSRAKAAAEDARNAVLRLNLVGELRSLLEQLEPVDVGTASKAWAVAAHLAARLAKEMSLLHARWNQRLMSGSRKKLSLAISQTETLRSQLHAFATRLPTGEELQAAVAAIAKVRVLLAGALGEEESRGLRDDRKGS
jgi:hypothetical protein